MNQEVAIHEPVSELITSAEWAARQFRKAWDAAKSALDAGMAGVTVTDAGAPVGAHARKPLKRP